MKCANSQLFASTVVRPSKTSYSFCTRLTAFAQAQAEWPAHTIWPTTYSLPTTTKLRRTPPPANPPPATCEHRCASAAGAITEPEGHQQQPHLYRQGSASQRLVQCYLLAVHQLVVLVESGFYAVAAHGLLVTTTHACCCFVAGVKGLSRVESSGVQSSQSSQVKSKRLFVCSSCQIKSSDFRIDLT